MTSYDEDYTDPKQRCIHGTFIGSWWGPDYLCQYCEEGIGLEEYEAICAYRTISSQLQAPGHMFDGALNALWVHCPSYRQTVLAILASVDGEGQPGTWPPEFIKDRYDSFLYEELAIAKANLTLARRGLERV